MRWSAVSPLLLTLILSPSACEKANPTNTDPFEVRKIPEELAGESSAVVESNTRFALDLYARLRVTPGNLFLAPFSISTALAMTYAGAAGLTEAEMKKVLHFSLDQNRLHPAYGALVESLDRGTRLGGYEINVANALFPQRGFRFLQSFLSTTERHYDAKIEELDYAADTDAARRRINSWVEERTRSKIKDLLGPRDLDPMTRLVLANAIYFKGLWAGQFDPEETSMRPFEVGDGRTVDVPMMRRSSEFPFADLDGLSILEMPYEGEDLSMIFFLPDRADGLEDLELRLNAEDLSNWMSALVKTELDVIIPKFSMTVRFSLGDVLAEMGMPSAFGLEADFSRMTGAPDLFISKVIHQAFVEVNEEGTEAAAATAVVMERESSEVRFFLADHPFLFLIRDNVTGSVLFMGRVADPS